MWLKWTNLVLDVYLIVIDMQHTEVWLNKDKECAALNYDWTAIEFG